MSNYNQILNNIIINTVSKYEPERSQPNNNIFVFSYEIKIINQSESIIQIIKHSWVITDAYANSEYLEGEGVAGKQPIISPGDTFSYESIGALKTNFGYMRGYLTALVDNKKTLKLEVPQFVLAHPYAIQ